MSSVQKSLAVAGVAFSASKFVFNAPTNLSLEDAAISAGSSFIADGWVQPLIVDVLPSMVQHVAPGIATGAVYLLAQQWKSTCPFANEVAQFLYGFGLHEVTGNLVVPLLSSVDTTMTNYGSFSG